MAAAARCYRSFWIDREPLLQYAPSSPHWDVVTPPWVAASPDLNSPLLLGILA